MKRFIKILLPVSLIIFIAFLILKPRSEKRTEKIANKVLINYLGEGFDTTNYNVVGPLVNVKNAEYTSFQWYKVLPWGDTASIYIDVFKRINSFSWRDNYFWPRITMNYKWNYLLGSLSNPEDVLPLRFKDKIYLNNQLKLYPNQETCTDSTELLISPDWLFFFLKKGYFRVFDKKENYTVVEFLEPIGNIICINGDKIDTISSIGAKVYVNDHFEVLIEPYKVPNNLW